VFQNKSIKVTQLAQDKEDENVWPINEFSEQLTRSSEIKHKDQRNSDTTPCLLTNNLVNKKRTISNISCENNIKL
jgi:hypothetical protein